MTKAPKILCFAGSLRKDSFNKRLAKLAQIGAEEAGATVTYIDLLDYPLPIFSEDLESAEGLPENAKKLKKLMSESDGFIIASPEYNSSISGVLKNTIDWISRKESPDEKFLSCFTNKTAVIMSASAGPLGGLRGLVHLRAILNNINTLVLPDQKCVPNGYETFDENGSLKDKATEKAIKDLGKKLADTLKKLNL